MYLRLDAVTSSAAFQIVKKYYDNLIKTCLLMKP